MKKRFVLALGILGCAALLMSAAPAAPTTNPSAPAANKQVRIGVVNFKQCVENSKLGKQEQGNFESLKKQMETVLADKEKTLNDMAEKFNDSDYLDSLSPEAETELKRKFRGLNQEISQQQQQYMQTLQQTNFKVIQKLNEQVTKAASAVAKQENLELVLNEEASFFYGPTLDISSKIIALLDSEFEKDLKEGKQLPAAGN